MHDENSDSLQNKIQYSCAVLSFTVNTLLIFLISKKSPKRLGAYKHLMMFISLFEIFYSLMDVLVSPVFYSRGSSYLLYMDLQESYFNRGTAFMLLDPVSSVIYCSCFGFSMATFGIHFVYRYLVATGSKLLKTFKGWRITWFLMVPFLVGLAWGVATFFFWGPNEITTEYLKNDILEHFDIKLEHTTYVGVVMYPIDENGQPYISMKPAIGHSILTLVVTSSLFTIFYFGIKCYAKIRKLMNQSTCSASFAGLQSQLFFSLVTQAVIPLILMHLPMSAIFIFTLMGIELGMTCGILSITIALYPAIDPIPTLFIIKNYRKALYSYLRRFLICHVRSSTQPKERSKSNTRGRTPQNISNIIA